MNHADHIFLRYPQQTNSNREKQCWSRPTYSDFLTYQDPILMLPISRKLDFLTSHQRLASIFLLYLAFSFSHGIPKSLVNIVTLRQSRGFLAVPLNRSQPIQACNTDEMQGRPQAVLTTASFHPCFYYTNGSLQNKRYASDSSCSIYSHSQGCTT